MNVPRFHAESSISRVDAQLEEICYRADEKLQKLISHDRLQTLVDSVAASLLNDNVFPALSEPRVPFEIRLGSTCLTSSELDSKEVEEIIPLMESPKGQVQIWSDGRMRASGTLLVVDGKLAVRVDSLAQIR
ncbi:MAG: FliM/FliN family flagellar motor C-terminal domain-containing protein [Thermoguttaceae bacterium]|jgi:flagellar motor switch/type III secretory pathway protein FliN